MPDSVLGKIAVEIGGGTAANGGGGGSPSSSSIAGGGDTETKKQLGLLGKMRDHLGTMTKNASGEPRFWTKMLKTMGIQVGLAGILKQSQIFTSTLGSLFQILGAFVDVILAPWMPLFIPMIRKLARQIPVVKKWSEDMYKQVTEVYGPWIKNMFIKMKDVFVTVKDKLIAAYDYIKKPDFFSRLVKDLGSLALGLLKDLVTNGLELLKRGWNLLARNMPGWFTDMFGELPQFPKGTTSWERKAAKDEADKLAELTGISTKEEPVVVKTPGMVTPPSDKDDKWRPTNIAPVDYLLNEAREKVRSLGDAFKDADIGDQIAIISAASIASAIANTTVLKSVRIMGQEVNLIRRLVPGMDVATGLTKVFGYPAQKATQLAAFAAKKAGSAVLSKAGEVTGLRPKVPKISTQVGEIGDTAFDAIKGGREWYTNARGKMVFGIKPKAVETLDEMVDPSRLQKLKRKIPKPTGILDFSKRVGGLGDEAGEVVGERGVARVVKPVVSATKTIAVEQLKKAIAKIEEFRGWLAKVKPGQSNLVLQANARMKVLWGAFGSIAHLPGGAALRPAFSYLTRAAKFLIPGLATVFVVRETKYEVEKMMKADMPWLKDPGNIESWKADAGVIGSGAAAGATSPYGGGIAQMLNIGPWGKDKEMGQASQRYMEAQALHFQEGALSQGKLAPIMMRLLGGSMELGGSLVGTPLGLALAGGGFGMNELARQRMGMGMGEGESYTEAQMMHDFRMLVPGWDSKTQKITIDGADGSQYTSGAET